MTHPLAYFYNVSPHITTLATRQLYIATRTLATEPMHDRCIKVSANSNTQPTVACRTLSHDGDNLTDVRSTTKISQMEAQITNKEISNTSEPCSDEKLNREERPDKKKTHVSLVLEKELSALEEQPKPKGVWGYVIHRYTWYIQRLQKTLEKEMPKTFKMFRIFGVGLKSFLSDFRGYVRVLASLSFPSVKLESLPRKDLELYHFMPWDMVKVFPVLAISAIPFGQNIGFPLGYLFPRHLLCRHFWDIQQTRDFGLLALQKRVYHAKPVFR